MDSAAPQESAAVAIIELIKRLAKPIDVKKAGQHVQVQVVPERLESPEFVELWNRIRHRTEYRIDVDEDELRSTLVKALRDMPPVPQRKGEWLTNVVERIDQSGLSAETVAVRRTDITYVDSEDLPDILSVLADQTQLTRATLAHVLTESGTLEQFRRNPQAYVGQVTTRIKSTKERFLVGGLRYELIDESRPENERRYPLTLFQDANLSGYTGKGGNIVSDYEGNPVSFDDKSVYEYVVVDSTVEREFALRLRQHEEVKAFVKLPPSFTVPTPLGTYNPDWAVTVERPDGSRYFVFETKGTTDEALLRESERGRIASARIHFMTVRARLGIDDVEYAVVDSMKTADGFFEGTRTLRSLE